MTVEGRRQHDIAVAMFIYRAALVLPLCGICFITSCTSLLGNDFTIFVEADDSSSGNGGGGGDSSEGGHLAGGGGSSPTTTVGGGEGGGGAAPQPCDFASLGTPGLCSAGNKCTIINPATGEVGCGPAGLNLNWEVCTDDADCLDGSFCDINRKVCKPLCKDANDCANFNGACLPILQSDGTTPIPNGPKACISMCDPKDAAPCPVAQGVTCVFVGSSQFDCAKSLGRTFLDACTTQADCGGGLACIDSSCERWCAPIGQSYPGCPIFSCNALSPSIFFMGVEHGSCF